MVIRKKKGLVKNSTLILLAFSTAFFPRLIEAIGAPSPVNFFHFFTIPFAVIVTLITTKTKEQKQIAISQKLVVGLLLLFAAIQVSALVNDAGVINVIIDYLLLSEPFMFLLAIVYIPLSVTKLKFFEKFLFVCTTINLLLALVQKPLIDGGYLYADGLDGTDGAQGVFFVSGAGNYVSTTVSIMYGLYYFFTKKTVPIWFRFVWLSAAFVQLIISDSKQTLIAAGLAFGILTLASSKKISKTLTYVLIAIVGFVGFIWCVEHLEAFSAFQGGLDKLSEWGPGGAARKIKTAPFRIATSYYESPANWLFGLGPGHTFGRLAGYFLYDYQNLLIPLHATVHSASADAWDAYHRSWIALESTIYAPFFGWAGIWGDLGLVGLGAYLYLASIVWRYLCPNDLPKFFMLLVLVVGLIFTQMEEPGYMLFTATLIGLNWHAKRLSDKTKTKVSA